MMPNRAGTTTFAIWNVVCIVSICLLTPLSWAAGHRPCAGRMLYEKHDRIIQSARRFVSLSMFIAAIWFLPKASNDQQDSYCTTQDDKWNTYICQIDHHLISQTPVAWFMPNQHTEYEHYKSKGDWAVFVQFIHCDYKLTLVSWAAAYRTWRGTVFFEKQDRITRPRSCDLLGQVICE